MADLKWRINGNCKIPHLQKRSYSGKVLYWGAIGVADYESEIEIGKLFSKFKMADSIWRINGNDKILHFQKRSYRGKVLYWEVFRVADYESEIEIGKLFL